MCYGFKLDISLKDRSLCKLQGFISQSPSEDLSYQKMDYINSPVIAKCAFQFGRVGVELDSMNRLCFEVLFSM